MFCLRYVSLLVSICFFTCWRDVGEAVVFSFVMEIFGMVRSTIERLGEYMHLDDNITRDLGGDCGRDYMIDCISRPPLVEGDHDHRCVDLRPTHRMKGHDHRCSNRVGLPDLENFPKLLVRQSCLITPSSDHQGHVAVAINPTRSLRATR